MSLKNDVKNLKELRNKINRLVRTDTSRAIGIARGEYQVLLDVMLIKYGREKLKESGVKFPRWMEGD